MPSINDATDCLVVVDVQNDFCPDGALAVPDGDAVVPVINALSNRFAHCVLTQDWHPAGHLSFASSHPDEAPFATITLAYGEQVLWPDHCVQGSHGAAFHEDLDTLGAELIVRKGFRREIDSYSAFYENDQQTATGLSGYLRTRGFQRLYLCGLATDFCVVYSALDARREGFDVFLLDDACRAIDLEGSLDNAWQRMRDAGVVRTESTQL
ncbi:MAG: bifunctional nicotinamidase/pyrazinamidase [Gammaproteobacteria bacterium]|nr:bifunctional nicotinamidase/pyrazinamidase [Gammaproteobacteria bacterium]